MKKLITFIASTTLLLFVSQAFAQSNKLCVKRGVRANAAGLINLSRAIRTTTGACKRGFTQIDVIQGAAGAQGVQGPMGPQGPSGANSFENISVVRVSSPCSASSYSGTTPVSLCSTNTFTKFENDTVLEVIFHGRVRRPTSMVGNAMSYEIIADGVGASGSGLNGGPGRVVVRNGDTLGNSDSSIQATIHGVYVGVPAGTGKSLTIRAKGFSAGDSGSAPQVDPGNYGSSYAIVREVRLPS